ncbi:hypothetical protein ACWEQ3_01530 [Streptomyces mirabilis]
MADLEARGVTVDAAETTVTGTYLDVASTLVREAAGSAISEVTSTVTLVGAAGAWLRLPGPPVSAVASVLVDGVAVHDFRLAGDRLFRACGWQDSEAAPSLITVTYTHGYASVPADVVDLVCRLAAQALLSYREGDPVQRAATSVRIGDYAVTYADSETGTMALSALQRKRLAARFGTGMVQVRAS